MLSYGDHYNFQPKDFMVIQKAFESITNQNKVLLVTEKDAARLVSNPNFPETLKPHTFCLPIRIKILQNQETILIQKIQNYVTENSRNS
jgi:tetraacyldisaccharide 4'-kinase